MIYDIQGSKMTFGDKHSYVIDSLKTRGWYEVRLEQLKKIIKPDWICVDVGAHIGYYTLMLSQLCKKVYAFEPDEYNFNMLNHNIELNQRKNVIPFACALGRNWCIAQLYKGVLCTGMNRTYISQHCSQSASPVVQIPLDSYVTHIDYIKIDAEGCEVDILKGMRRLLETVSYIQLEFEPDSIREKGDDPNEIFTLLERFKLRQEANRIIATQE